MKQTETKPAHAQLNRHLGLWGAVMMGLGAMVGTGVFVSIGVAAGIAGASVVLAILVAAGVAVCNALSSAQLAAAHPVSGGTYEYGYKYLHPTLGFTAGWMFLCAKSASAATAALGFGGYLLHVLGRSSPAAVTWLGAIISILITLLVLSGLKRSNLANILIVATTLIALIIFVGFAGAAAIRQPGNHLVPFFPEGESSVGAFLQACALMFVAYTGYGRIATMGEEVQNPQKNIPRAIIAVTSVSAVLYMAVGLAAIGAFGAVQLGEATRAQAAPLEIVLRTLGHPVAATIVALGAMTAMLGVLLNLILGLSRVALAMGRRGDLPSAFSKIDRKGSTPTIAVIGVGCLVTGLAVLGDVKLTWSFSAFTVLVYYAITNLAALRLQGAQRLYPRWISMLGIAACLFLAFWVDPGVWMTGLGLIAAGLLWHRFSPSV
ncbi:MAG: amino acid permease [Verrucomicrobia bacterium]|nr:amino acid permease [Verrucomicrobiota bacterium]MCH8512495.1 APC family permease [Kiritimatiellia bacterium]